MRQTDGAGIMMEMRLPAAFLLAAALAHAGVDGAVTNGTNGKPQAGSTVTLYQTTNQGPQNLGSVKTDAQGKFAFTQDVQPGVGGGPLLLQAVYGGVQYNNTITPGTPTTGVEIPVYESTKTPGGAKVDQHMMVLEPAPNGNLQVTESYIFTNAGKTTWNDPDRGTLQFALPAAANGKVEVNVLAPGGLPIRRAADPGTKPNTFKLDFPIKPGESRVDLSWGMPFTSPGEFQEQVLAKAGATRLVAPVGVAFSGDGVTQLGQEPTTKAMIYNVAGPDIRVKVEGTGLFRDPSQDAGAGGGGGDANNGSPGVSENLPKLYGLLLGNANLGESMLAVKWILATVLGMLALGFALLYRKGDPMAAAPGESGGESEKASESATNAASSTKASGHARGRG
jgi:hypothetical protein